MCVQFTEHHCANVLFNWWQPAAAQLARSNRFAVLACVLYQGGRIGVNLLVSMVSGHPQFLALWWTQISGHRRFFGQLAS